MDELNHLVTLKRAATDIRGLDAYVASLYRCTTAWGGGVTIGVAALVYDGLIDTIAHEQAQEATGADLTAERPLAHVIGSTPQNGVVSRRSGAARTPTPNPSDPT